jgi:hypothetical protein
MPSTHDLAQSYLTELRDRTDALGEGLLSDEEFRDQQIATWEQIHAAPQVERAVLRMLRAGGW